MPRTINLVLFFAFFINFASETLAVGNAASGKKKAAPCAGCHGPDGNSIAPLFPRLAGQHAGYIISQLKAFKTEERSDETMQAMVATMSEKHMEDISAFYTDQTPIINGSEEEQYLDEDEDIPVTQDLINAGRKLYRGGNSDTGVSACIACHGPNGLGNASAGFPAIKGQFAVYVTKSLNDFKTGERKDSGSMMSLISEKMTAEEIHAVSAFVSSMR